MPKPVLILGGYGNFGKRIAEGLVRKRVRVVIAGRSLDKAQALASQLPEGLAEAVRCDVVRPLDDTLKEVRPGVVVNTCGPFQMRDYAVAKCCIRNGAHYIDLADGRKFVTGINALDRAARKAGIAVVAGASTVPGLSSAVIEHFRDEFTKIANLTFGISPGQKAERGLATTEAILSYVGRPLDPFPSAGRAVYGWQDIYRQDYPLIGRRWMANCDIPDLDLLPEKYGIQSIRFSAGLELGLLHLGLWGLSWVVRAGIPVKLQTYASRLLSASNWMNRFGTADGGMHMILEGVGKSGKGLRREWFIIARNGDGPHIPTIPAILLAERMSRGAFKQTGAMPCLGLVDLESCLEQLSDRAVTTHTASSQR